MKKLVSLCVCLFLIQCCCRMALSEAAARDESRAEGQSSDYAVTVKAEDDLTALSAGRTLQFKAVFGNPKAISAAAQNNRIAWSVAMPDDAEVPPEVTISGRGLLTVKRSLKDAVDIIVTAASVSFGTVGEYPLTLYPAADKVTVAPAGAKLYLNEKALTLTAHIEPDNIPPSALTWSVQPLGIVEMTDNGDGTATLKPLRAGTVTVTAKEVGGKAGRAQISVGKAVYAIEVSMKGKARPGALVTFSARLQPTEALDKKIVWSTDADESIASIDKKTGELRIRRSVPEGTVIHVTATAQGAPRPISVVLDVEVVK